MKIDFKYWNNVKTNLLVVYFEIIFSHSKEIMQKE